jgi:hypothetical protein
LVHDWRCHKVAAFRVFTGQHAADRLSQVTERAAPVHQFAAELPPISDTAPAWRTMQRIAHVFGANDEAICPKF